MKPPALGDLLDTIALAITGLPAELQDGIREVVRVNQALAERCEQLEHQHQEDATEIARLHDLVTTQSDAIKSVKRAVAAWEQLLEL